MAVGHTAGKSRQTAQNAPHAQTHNSRSSADPTGLSELAAQAHMSAQTSQVHQLQVFADANFRRPLTPGTARTAAVQRQVYFIQNMGWYTDRDFSAGPFMTKQAAENYERGLNSQQQGQPMLLDPEDQDGWGQGNDGSEDNEKEEEEEPEILGLLAGEPAPSSKKKHKVARKAPRQTGLSMSGQSGFSNQSPPPFMGQNPMQSGMGSQPYSPPPQSLFSSSPAMPPATSGRLFGGYSMPPAAPPWKLSAMSPSTSSAPALSSPQQTQSPRPTPRRKINIGDNRWQPSPFKSRIPKSTPDKDAVLKFLKHTGGTGGFYKKIRLLLKSARDDESPTQKQDIKTLDTLVAAYRAHKEVKAKFDSYGFVRVRPKQPDGTAAKIGVDELFKTSETIKFLEWSYKPPSGKSATASIFGKEFDWMDAQERLRLSNELIIWATDLCGQICGHTGTFQRKFKDKWMTACQGLMHEVRQENIEMRSNPAGAIVQVLSTHLRLTENLEWFSNAPCWSADEAQDAMMLNGWSVADCADTLSEALARNRDKIKDYYAIVKAQAKAQAGASPLFARSGSGDEVLNSPRRPNAMTSPVHWSQAADANNPLLDLSDVARVDWVKANAGRNARRLPTPPPNPVVTTFEAKLTEVLGKSKKSKLRRGASDSAKRVYGKTLDLDQRSLGMLRYYLNRIDDGKIVLINPQTATQQQGAEYAKLIADMKTEITRLTALLSE